MTYRATTKRSFGHAAPAKRRIRGLTAGLAVGAAAFVMATAESATGPAKPQTKFLAEVRVEEAPYAIRVFLQEGKSFGDTDAHVYYEPVITIKADSEGNLFHSFDRQGNLVLKARFDTRYERMAELVREHILRLAIERGEELDLKEGTKPYRISVLDVSNWNLATTNESDPAPDSPRVSIRMKAGFSSKGEIAVTFPFGDKDEGASFVEELNEGIVNLYFSYRFSGVSDEKCSATLRSNSARSSDLFKNVAGEGREGYVARHQVVKIAELNQVTAGVETRCNNFQVANMLLDRLLRDLDIRAPKSMLSFDELRDQVAFDEDSFKADVVDKVKEISKQSDREIITKAIADASSAYDSEQTSVGAQGGYAGFVAGLNASFAESAGRADTSVRKSLQDTLSKVGLYTEWEGKKLVPKALDVHSTGELEAALTKDMSVEISLPDPASAGYSQILTREGAWAEAVEPADQKEIGRKFKEIDEQHHALAAAMDRSFAQFQDDLSSTLEEAKEHTLASIEDALELSRQRTDKAITRSRESIEKGVAQEIRKAKNSANSYASRTVSVRKCKYKLDLRNRDPFHYFSTRATDDIAIIATHRNRGCDENQVPEISISRMSENVNRWTFHVGNVDDDCDLLWVDVVYLNGTRVPVSRTFWTRSVPSASVRPEYCYN